MKPYNDHAVSPVVGVMLMIAVTIIIAALVSAFAGGALGGNSAKTPQATIKAVFSQSGGMQITNTGGDTLATANLIFTVVNDANFGQGLSAATTQIINKGIITDASGNALQTANGTSNVYSFGPGETLYISKSNIACSTLQPQVGAGSPGPDLSRLCFVEAANIGRSFTLTVSDKASGAVIAKTDVQIDP